MPRSSGPGPYHVMLCMHGSRAPLLIRPLLLQLLEGHVLPGVEVLDHDGLTGRCRSRRGGNPPLDDQPSERSYASEAEEWWLGLLQSDNHSLAEVFKEWKLYNKES